MEDPNNSRNRIAVGNKRLNNEMNLQAEIVKPINVIFRLADVCELALHRTPCPPPHPHSHLTLRTQLSTSRS
eukprot:COSAG06_NODE_16159_length_1018_cov_0.763874_2_plen_72_part_00